MYATHRSPAGSGVAMIVKLTKTAVIASLVIGTRRQVGFNISCKLSRNKALDYSHISATTVLPAYKFPSLTQVAIV